MNSLKAVVKWKAPELLKEKMEEAEALVMLNLQAKILFKRHCLRSAK